MEQLVKQTDKHDMPLTVETLTTSFFPHHMQFSQLNTGNNHEILFN